MASGITIVGMDKVQKAINQLAIRAKDQAPCWKIIGEVLQTSADDQFDSQGKPAWKPLAESTIEGRRQGKTNRTIASKKGGWSSPLARAKALKKISLMRAHILVDTGRLRRSIWIKVGKTYVEQGSNLVYAATHQFGRGKIPARPFLVINPDTMEEIVVTIAAYLVEPFKA